MRQHLEKIFGLQIDKENQELRAKFSYLAGGAGAAAGARKEDWTETHSSKTVTMTLTSDELRTPPPAPGVSFWNVALGLFLAMVGGWAAMMFQGEKTPEQDLAVVNAAPGTSGPPPVRNLAQVVKRKELQALRLDQGPLEGQDVQAISLIQSSLAKRGDGPPMVSIRVTAGGGKPTTLVLSSIEAVSWQISVERGAQLDRILLNELGDEQEPSEVKLVAGARVPSEVERVRAGFLPFGAEASRAVQKRPASMKGHTIRIGTPDDLAFALAAEICFQDAVEQAQVVTGRCQPVHLK